jgi:hypothetical protein
LARGDGDGRLLEIRSRRSTGMAQRFVPAADTAQAAAVIGKLGARTDVYVGVLLRDQPAGGRAAISGGRVVFVEVDATAARELLSRAPAPPSIVVGSGTPGHLHAYWLLRERASSEQIEAANRKLCHRVAGDRASVDCARILRPPQTLNYKHTPARLVQLLALDERRIYPLAELTQGLEDPRPVRPPTPITVRQAVAQRRSRPAGDLLHAQLRQISTANYVLYLTGQEANREGKVHCPFHEGDRTPSLQCYDDGTFCCFGCLKGGTIFDFAGGLWGVETKGRDFIVLRQRLGDTFGLADRAAPRPAPAARPSHLRRQSTHDNQEVQR